MALVINLLITPLSLPLANRMLDATLMVSQLLTWGLVACLVRELVYYGVRRIRCLWWVEKNEPIPT